MQPQIQRDIPGKNRTTIAQLMESRIAVLGSQFKSHWKYEKWVKNWFLF